jgi:hypothetical protein
MSSLALIFRKGLSLPIPMLILIVAIGESITTLIYIKIFVIKSIY